MEPLKLLFVQEVHTAGPFEVNHRFNFLKPKRNILNYVLQHSTVAWRAIIYPCKDFPLAIAVCGLT